MPHMIWSSELLADVLRLYRFLADKNPDAARRAASAIRDGMQVITDHPDAGRPVDDMDPEFHARPISFGASGYVVLDRLDRNVALVVAVRHQKEVAYKSP